MAEKTTIGDTAQLFREIVSLLLHTPELDEALRLTLTALCSTLPEPTIGHYRYWPEIEELELVAVMPVDAGSLVGTYFLLEGWLPGEVVQTREVIHLPFFSLKPEAPTVDLLCMPVLGVDRDVIGVLQAASTKPNAFSDEDLNTLRAAASLIGLAEENVRRGEALEAATIHRLYTEHVSAMADMTSHITHQIVNEMGAVRLAVQVMRRKYAMGKLDDAEFDGIEQNAEHTIALLRRIRRPFDKIDTMPLRLEPMLDEVLGQLVPPNVILIRQGEIDLPHVSATRNLFEVFHHLISNALDAMSEVEEKRLVVATRISDEGQVEVIMQDSGPGIPEPRLKDLFNLGPSEKRDGLGYGLWWSRLYLARIGGFLQVDPNVSQGARITVRLCTAGK